MAKHKGIRWLEKLDAGETNGVGGVGVVVFTLNLAIFSVLGRAQCGGDKKSNIVIRVGLHDFTSSDRPIQPFHFPIGLLYDQSCSVNGLTISHL